MSDFTYAAQNGRAWLFHPSGVKLEMPLPDEPELAFKFINECLNAGFLASAPDNSGLDKLDISYAIRGQVNNDDRIVDRIYFYADWAQQSSNMTVYLNTDDDRAKFERASGLIVANMSMIKGKKAPDKGTAEFEKVARPVNFTITRRKAEDKGSPVGYRWELVDYVGIGKPTQTAQKPPKTPLDAITGDESTEDSEDYEKIAMKWFTDNGMSVVTAMNDLHIKKNAMPKKEDKAGWASFCKRYAEFVKSKAVPA